LVPAFDLIVASHAARRYIQMKITEEYEMTKLLEKAVSTAANLTESDQDALASVILEELADEERWTKSFSTMGSQLSKLAREAIAEYESGKTEPLDI